MSPEAPSTRRSYPAWRGLPANRVAVTIGPVTPGPPPFTRHSASPAELRARLEADRSSAPYLLYRDSDGEQQIFTLPSDRDGATIGRGPACDVCLGWDAEVSRVHAKLERLGDDWTVADENLSRNGTFINGERLRGRRPMRSGDLVRCGETELGFRAPAAQLAETAPPRSQAPSVQLSPAQRRVLVALCRPYTPSNPFPRPATNRQIADELVLSEAAVKTHLRTLFERFGVEDLPNNAKRARLVELALTARAVSPRDLESGDAVP
jgi:DNA-binding MarR family transcriptional regulator